MDKQIQKEFIDGTYEVYSIMFTDGVNDGIYLYLLDNANGGFYKESKIKTYKEPVLLVAKAQANMNEKGDANIEKDMKDFPTFTVPFKSLRDNGVACQNEQEWDELKKAYIKFHDHFYEVHNVRPQTFVEDVFLFLVFECEYRKDVTELKIVEPPEPPEEIPEEQEGE